MAEKPYLIYLFGTPQILYQGQVVEIARKPTRALLFYLAAIGKPILRARLIDLIFGDDPDGRNKMRETLGKLRRDLPDPDLIQAANDTVFLDLSRAEIDYLEFSAIQTDVEKEIWRLSSEEPLSDALYQKIARIGSMWRGQDFLSGALEGVAAEVYNWQSEINSGLITSMSAIGRRLALHEMRWGVPQNAARWISMVLKVDPYDEELHYGLLRALIAMKDFRDARLRLDRYKELFSADKPSEWGKKIFALEKQIANRTQDINVEWAVHVTVPAPFVGREKILEELKRAYRAGGAAIIFGEAGLGKTCLVQEFYRRIDPLPRALIASCSLNDADLPYAPWSALLRKVVSREEWRELNYVWAEPLATIIPEIRKWRDDLPDREPTAREQSRTVLFEAIHQALIQIAESGTLLIFLDDAHWADEGTLAVAAYLLKHGFFANGNAFLVLAARVEEDNSRLDQFVLTSYPQRLRRMELERLADQEIAALARSVLGREIKESTTKRLAQDTGGNAIFVLELLLSLSNAGVDMTLAQYPASQTVEALISRRIQLLSEDAQDKLRHAAILGNHFNLAVLEHMTQLSGGAMAAIMVELEQARLVQLRDSDRYIYVFIHEIIRESLLKGMPKPIRRSLHQKAARAITRDLRGKIESQAAVLARHYENAGEFSQAFDAWIIAARYSYRLASVEGATDNYQRAERLITRAPSLSDDQLYQLYFSWSDMCFENDDPKTLERINQSLLNLGQERGSDLLIGNAYDGLSDACFTSNRFEEGEKFSDQAIPYLERSGNTFELMEAQNHRGVFCYMQGRPREGQPYFLSALALGSGLDDLLIARALGNANFQMSITETMLGFPASGLEYARQSYIEYGKSHNMYGQGVALSAIGLAQYFLFDHQNGYRVCLEGIDVTKKIDGWRMMGYNEGYASFHTLEMGMLDAAWTHAQNTIRIGQEHGHNEIVAIGYRTLGDIYARLGAYSHAAQVYQQGIAIAGQNFMALEHSHRLGYALVCMDQREMGHQYIQGAIAMCDASGLDIFSMYARLFQAMLFFKEGRRDEFDQLAAWFAEEYPKRTNREFHFLDAYHAHALYEQGRVEDALKLIRAAQKFFEKHFLLWLEIACLKTEITILSKIHQPDDLPRERMSAIFERIDAQIGGAPVSAEWEHFKQTEV
jgi:DNA-binding SARP family transcriptional activator/tetratricopeptide (TPR) repeat protein